MHGRPGTDELESGAGMRSPLRVNDAHLSHGQNHTGHGMTGQGHRSAVERFGGDFTGMWRDSCLNQGVNML